jgi:hypothetical protein
MKTITLETKDNHYTETVKKYIESELALLDEAKLEQVYQYIKKLSQKQTNSKPKNKAILLLEQSGFIGCGEADPNLSSNYKNELNKILTEKYANH